MKIGVYSKELGRGLAQNINNLLIINKIKARRPATDINFFFRKNEQDPDYPEHSAQYFPLPDGIAQRLGALTGQHFALSRLLKKQDIGALLLLDVREIRSVRIPQFLLLSDQYKLVKKDALLFQKLAGIVVSSEKIKAGLISGAGVAPENIFVTGGITGEGLGRTDIIAQQHFKEGITGGKEFFICADDHWTKESLVLVLKAFSRFKKMQQTNWKLLLTHRGFNPETTFRSVLDTLHSYKYRDEVLVFAHSERHTYAQALGAAYAAISTKTDDGFPAAVAEALMCGTTALVPDTLAEASLPVLPAYQADDEESLGIKMMELYKNESLRRYYTEEIKHTASYGGSGAGLEQLMRKIFLS